MKTIILFADWKNSSIGDRLQRAIAPVTIDRSLECFSSISELSRRLHRFPKKIDVVVLLAESKHQLLEFLSLNEVLGSCPVILILPDKDRETVSSAHQLRPRFLTYADSDFKDIYYVLGKMLNSGHYDEIIKGGLKNG